MIEKTFIIKNKLGLHARAAALFVQTANKFLSEISVEKGEDVVDGKSILGIMMLAAACGTHIKVKIKGSDAQEVLQAIEKIIENKFGEED
ncbi:MAG: HPr family phosphocarrier protein [bacterium]